jgi:hypothetical protein
MRELRLPFILSLLEDKEMKIDLFPTETGEEFYRQIRDVVLYNVAVKPFHRRGLITAMINFCFNEQFNKIMAEAPHEIFLEVPDRKTGYSKETERDIGDMVELEFSHPLKDLSWVLVFKFGHEAVVVSYLDEEEEKALRVSVIMEHDKRINTPWGVTLH